LPSPTTSLNAASKQFGALFKEVGAYLKGEAPDTEA
jgi:hypothetical protein